MVDTFLISLVKDWSKTLTYESSFSSVCRIADYLEMPKPNDYKTYRSVLNYLDINYPDAYLEATKSSRDFFNIV